MIVQYRFSDPNFVAYLITIGYVYDKIETTFTNKSGARTFVYFTAEAENLLSEQEKYKTELIPVNLETYSKNRKQIAVLMANSKSEYLAGTKN